MHNLDTRFWLVGIMELFDETIFHISDVMNLSKPHDFYKKVSVHTPFRPSFWQLPRRIQNQIERKTQHDQALYERDRIKFEASTQYLYEKDYFLRHYDVTNPVRPGHVKAPSK